MKRLIFLALAISFLVVGCGDRASSPRISPEPVSSDYEQGYEEGLEDAQERLEDEAMREYEEHGVDIEAIAPGALDEAYGEGYDQGYVDGYLDAVHGEEPIFDIDY